MGYEHADAHTDKGYVPLTQLKTFNIKNTDIPYKMVQHSRSKPVQQKLP